mmetsp:Transcript_59359/g.130045  ORF Transcript_59359/g.130045 Transcript_59359/m.130045 type:complete len:580 (+) Transcript_59359:94-1833(+)
MATPPKAAPPKAAAAASSQQSEVPSKLPNRIEGFGNGPPPPPLPESTADVLWSAVTESWSGTDVEGTFSGWFTSASDAVENMVTAFDEAVDGIADALDEVVGGMLDEDEEWPETQRTCPAGHQVEEKSGAAVAYLSTRACDMCSAPIPRGHPRWSCATCNYDMCRLCFRRQGVQNAAAPGAGAQQRQPATPDVSTAAGRIRVRVHRDNGQRSGVDWVAEVAEICKSGSIEEFVARVRNRSANAAEQGEVGRHLADQLLNEVEADDIHRVLYVIQGVVEGDLKAAKDEIEVKCKVKLQRLQAAPRFKALATELVQTIQPRTPAEPAAASSGGEQAASTGAGAVEPVDLLDMDTPVPVATNTPSEPTTSDAADLLQLGSPPSADPSPTKPAAADTLLDLGGPPAAEPPQANPAAAAVDDLLDLAGPAAAEASPAKSTGAAADDLLDMGPVATTVGPPSAALPEDVFAAPSSSVAAPVTTSGADNILLDLDFPAAKPAPETSAPAAIDGLGDLLELDASQPAAVSSSPPAAESWAAFSEPTAAAPAAQGWAAFDDSAAAASTAAPVAAGTPGTDSSPWADFP